MTFSAALALVSGKRPYWLYAFERDGETAYLTSSPVAIDADIGESPITTFEPATINHSRFMRTSAIGREETDITFPQSDDWARRYLGDQSYIANSVRVWQGFANDTDSELALRFRGRVTGVKPSLSRIVLSCENRFTRLRRKGLSAVMQRPCRHALYHNGCGLSIASFEVAGTVSALTGNLATVAEASARAAGYYSGGVLTFNGRRQLITSHSGSALRLLGPVPGLADALDGSPGTAAVTIAPGCNLSSGDCLNKFNNLANFGGFEFMTDTPYGGKALF